MLEFSKVDFKIKEYDFTTGHSFRDKMLCNGKLRKYVVKNEFNNMDIKIIKTGRSESRDYRNVFGIEPLIECIVYELGTALNMNIAEQELGVAKIKLNNKKQDTLVNISDSFIPYGEDLVEIGTYNGFLNNHRERIITLEDLRSIVGLDPVKDLLLLDYITMNEDRHNHNIALLINSRTKEIKLAPIYDSGYSLLYDDVDRIGKFKNCSRNAVCNASLYNCAFSNLERLVKKYTAGRSLDGINVEYIVNKYRNRYNLIKSEHNLNNIELTDNWFNCIIEFLKWRIDLYESLQVDAYE